MKLVNWYGKGELIPKKLENNIFKLRPERRGETRSALESPTKILNRDVAPIGNDIEPVEVPREDVGIGIDEDEEPLTFLTFFDTTDIFDGIDIVLTFGTSLNLFYIVYIFFEKYIQILHPYI